MQIVFEKAVYMKYQTLLPEQMNKIMNIQSTPSSRLRLSRSENLPVLTWKSNNRW